MFTGLVETVGTLVSFRPAGMCTALSLRAPLFAGELVPGQSVAVCGACLTVTALEGEIFSVDVMPETLKKTKLRSLRPGARVNLERALRADGRLDGHIVTGHIDGVVPVREISRGRDGFLLTFTLEEETASLVVLRGSVAVDGVSLTVARLAGSSCTVGLIPATLEATTLGDLRPGDEVNIETDILGKYVRRLLETGASFHTNTGASSLSPESLRDAGWI